MKLRSEGKNIVKRQKNLKRIYDIDYRESNREKSQLYKKNYF